MVDGGWWMVNVYCLGGKGVDGNFYSGNRVDITPQNLVRGDRALTYNITP
ncbi:hypothetical protein [Chamaesiphon sp. OTE_8_metabat_110]|nr:hypothetical protein [Chamaesiphon sp. OTE_8_metabat_110]